MAAELDKLRDDGARDAGRLREAGVPVTHEVLAGQIHPSFAFTCLVPGARRYESAAVGALRRALHPEDQRPGTG